MAKRITKEELARQAFAACKDTFELIDVYFLNVPNTEDSLTKRVFGVDADCPRDEDEKVAKAAFRTTELWRSLERLYDYAVDGVLPTGEYGEEIVIGGAEALTLVSSENVGFEATSDAFAIVNAGDARFALDSGQDLEISKLADLANVDERTVRNAVSAGELMGKGKPIYLDNQSARTWLRNRRGFRPTQVPSKENATFSEINTPTEFGAFLKAQYERLYPDTQKGTVMPMHSQFDASVFDSLEAGVFSIPLGACSTLADFYKLERQLFLIKVMQIFYSDELHTLRQAAIESQGGAS